jgi:hypothetical protein
MTTNLIAYSRSIRRGAGYSFVLAPLVLGAMLWPFPSAKKVPMVAGHETPAAHGTIMVKDTDNNNAKLDIKVQSLAEPTALTPPKNAYVVWIQPQGEQPQNQGELKVNDKQEGELHTVTPYQRFKVFITAEQNAQAKTPSGPQVLTADVSQG